MSTHIPIKTAGAQEGISCAPCMPATNENRSHAGFLDAEAPRFWGFDVSPPRFWGFDVSPPRFWGFDVSPPRFWGFDVSPPCSNGISTSTRSMLVKLISRSISACSALVHSIRFFIQFQTIDHRPRESERDSHVHTDSVIHADELSYFGMMDEVRV